MRNPCKECDYYHSENNTCQSKKCCTGGDGYITWIDRLFCKPYKYNADRKTESDSEKPNDCETCKWGEWYRQGYDITMMDDECGGCCSWNSKWTPKDEPQTDTITFTYTEEEWNEIQDWKDRMWSEAIVTEPTVSKMEQVDKDINVRSKDEPQTDYGDYEREVEQMQHDMRYEPTYNAEDGSM